MHFLQAAAATGKEKEYLETVVLPAIEKDQEYQKRKVSQILEQTIKEQNERCKNQHKPALLIMEVFYTSL